MPAPEVRNSAAPGTISSRSRSGTSPHPVRPPCMSERSTRSPTPTAAPTPWKARRCRWSMRFSRVKVSFDIVPAGMFWNPKWPCRSTSVGITVLPEMSTRVAPAGTVHLAAPADLREPIVLDHEGGVLDRRAAVPGDEARALEHRHRRGLRQRRRRPSPGSGLRRTAARMTVAWCGTSGAPVRDQGSVIRDQ